MIIVVVVAMLLLFLMEQPIGNAVAVICVIAYGIVGPRHRVTDSIAAQTNVTGGPAFVMRRMAHLLQRRRVAVIVVIIVIVVVIHSSGGRSVGAIFY